MKQSTYVLTVLIKWCELIFVALLVITMWISAISLSVRLVSDAPYLTSMVILACVIALYHLIYQTLLTNLRFACKKNCFSCGKCFFDLLNIIICHKCCARPCSEKKTSVWFVFKWVF